MLCKEVTHLELCNSFFVLQSTLTRQLFNIIEMLFDKNDNM